MNKVFERIMAGLKEALAFFRELLSRKDKHRHGEHEPNGET